MKLTQNRVQWRDVFVCFECPRYTTRMLDYLNHFRAFNSYFIGSKTAEKTATLPLVK
jgi:hypothetical protein